MMGSLNFRTNEQSKAPRPSAAAGGDHGQGFSVEQVEKKLAAAKIRLELEVAAWLENVSFQLTETGKELVEEVGITVNQLLVQASEKGVNAEGFVQDLDIKFIPRSLKRFELGFLCHGDLLPSSLTLQLVTRIVDITVGARVIISVEAEGLISPLVKNSLDLSVLTETEEAVPCQEAAGSAGGNGLLFSFTIPSAGQYLVSATLYKQNIVGSPLVIPVSWSPATGLAQLGLAAIGENSAQVATMGENIAQVAVMEENTGQVATKGENTGQVATKGENTGQVATKGENTGQVVALSPILSPHLGRMRKDALAQAASLPLKASLPTRPGGLPVSRGGSENTSCLGEVLEKKFVMGALCFARWDHDGVWYNAKIDKDCRERGVEVTFVDYDNSDFVQRENIVWRKEDIPQGAGVDLGQEVFGVGEDVVAQWEEDGVWYNARVMRLEEGGYSVLFTDYENDGLVEASQIYKAVADIPQCEVLDVHLQLLVEDSQAIVENISEDQNLVSTWAVGNDCLARWVEDGRWYNAIVDTVFGSSPPLPVQYLVTFTDYGNSEIVTTDDMAANVEDIPGDQLDMLDENVERADLPPTVVTEQVPSKPLVRTNLLSPVPRCDRLVKGSKMIAKREEDLTWHRAVIHEVVAPGMLYIVRYDDIGQYGGAGPENIVMVMEDIPHGENIGQDVTEERADWKAGDSCIARWSQDNTWYSAEVLSVGESYLVKFVDYGNEENVIEQDMVKTVEEIPSDCLVDENIDQALEVPKVERETVSYEGFQDPMPVPKAPRPLKAASIDQARLLVTAVSAAAGEACSVPASLQCCLCSNICRKGMRVACDSSPVCWGCAVKEITRGHVCWLCGERNITSDSHLVKDQVLRSFVEQFISTGKLDPAHERALSNGLMQPHVENESRSVEQVSNVKEEPLGVSENDSCLAKFSEDGVWYNGIVTDVYGDGSAMVYFLDYGNSERVQAGDLVTGVECIPDGARVDPHVELVTPAFQPSSSSEKLNLLSLSTPGEDGVVMVTAKETLTIKDLKGPVGVAVLADGSMAVACRGANSICRYSREGAFLGVIRPGREFVKPSDILTLASGEFVVRDDRGIQLFGDNLEFVKIVAEESIDHCFGLAEDDEGRIITINCNTVDEGRVKITLNNNTDIFFIDKISNKVIKRIEMVDLIEDALLELKNLQADMSACRFLSYHSKKLYVVDLGLDCIFILNKDGTESELFGSRGNKGGEFRDPAGLVVDDSGTMMVVDSRNHRLQLINSDLSFAGLVKVDTPLARPSGICVDRVNKEILVSNYLGKSVVRYKLGPMM